MLPKRERLSRHIFAHLLAKGRRTRGGALSVLCMPGESRRASVVVSKKTARRATARRLLRRRLYHALAQLTTPRTALYIAVFASPQAVTLSFQALKEELASLLIRAASVRDSRVVGK